ncbi:LacI family DNA-binding transcriptional regulator [Variovorax sp. J22G21]|uniref:LacI family DNA-binding transcriptional regulator n=1 Tax=Variovorax fucosicus TaxID=3053517 RepID=UPI00257861EB|nr:MULTISPECIES: LacI family DNA-binding transcriptional regulator [unclassified Variovorax]MDM0042624.1 LacI family DNA-binding transcriptional regulator [Variovorax sp. J22R193]MDM0061229.1 LacI family DNA-binding transcriptional regulator [Variovorax sp. J22G21]
MTQQNTPGRSARRGSGGITLSDVSKLAGVSAITVSRALNTPDLVSPETREKVRLAVERTGYVPNLLAGGLASNRSRLVAALVPTIAGPVFLETIQALTEALADKGYQLMLGQSGYNNSREDALIDAIVGRRPDGIVLTGIMRSAEGRRRLLASGIPVVETWDLTPTPVDMLVGFSHEKAGVATAQFLHRKGYRRPAIVTGDDHRANLRRGGFEQAWRALGGGAVPVHAVPAPTTLGSGRAALSELLAADPATDVVACSSDALAHGVITEAQARGLRVPQDVGVIGFGDLAFARHAHPAITTVRIDGTAIGRQAARFIVDRAEGRPVEHKVLDLGFSLIERESA